MIGNANSPHAVNIMKGIDQASKECDVQIMYFMNVSSPYTAQLYPPDTSIGWDYQKSAIYDYARYVKADVLIMTYGMMSIFTQDEEVIAIGTTLLRMIAFTEPVFGTSAVMEGIYNGMGRTRYPLVVELISMWGVRVVGTFVCIRILGLGITSAWMMMICNNILKAVLLALGLVWMGKKDTKCLHKV